MPRFEEVKRFDHAALEREVLTWWEQRRIFEKSVRERANRKAFTFYEGPPTANGRPGIHHVMARTIKDVFCRYKTMKGFYVERKAGWDTHGLPVEIEVEKALGLTGREDIERYGVGKYNEKCRESVLRYKEVWDDLTRKMGYWVDLDNPYVTFENRYIETEWWLLKKIYEKGLLYKGHKIQWYSPGSGTVLSSHEVSLGYEEVQDPSVYVRFPVRDQGNTAFLAWTTTPWTLISNTALAVGADIEYVKVRLGNASGDEECLILAEERLDVLDTAYEIIRRFQGKDIVGMTYAPVFPYFLDEGGKQGAWRVVEADFVSTEEGTGIVHLAPAFGADDHAIGQKEGLPLFNPVDAGGRFTDQIPLVSGQWFKEADKPIVRDLRDRGMLYKQETHLHNYPHDWRKGTPLLNYPVESWFVRTTAIKDRMIALNDTINWQPSAMGTGRFGEWLKNNVDWALSRRRYWGTPLPIWQSDKKGSDYIEVIGSMTELREKCGNQLPEKDKDVDLHRPFVDTLIWPAPDGGTMRRVPEVIDVWFDSGSMPFAQWHYPFENKEKFERHFPADFIAEGIDQTRGWFYTMHVLAAAVTDSVAYENVVVNGLVLDENGEKMSKSRGNAVDPFETIARYGADTVRWYMMSNSPPWENIKFSERGLGDTLRKFFGTLGNVYAFFATYANIDGFAYEEVRIPVNERPELDRWIVSLLHSTVGKVDEAYHTYDPTRAARGIEQFVEELSNWYIRRSRRRFWKEADTSKDKEAAYQTVYECLATITAMMAPIAPFFSDWLHRALEAGTGSEECESVHLAFFPKPVENEIDQDLERRMALARTISSIALSMRNRSEINVRQPLSRILVVTGEHVSESDIEQVRAIILDEINIRAIEYIPGSSGIVKRSARPDFKRLGPRLGKWMKPVARAVRTLDDEQIGRYVQEGTITIEVGNQRIELGAGDIEVTSEEVAGWLVGQENDLTVALDTTLTEELIAEGQAREIVNRMQNLRKGNNFEVTDRILVEYHTTGRLSGVIRRHGAWIRNETLALEFNAAQTPEGDIVDIFRIGEEMLRVGVRRIENS